MLRKVVRLFDISIHAPCEGGDADRMRPLSKTGYFNPRPLRGGRQSRFTRTLFTKNISIHAPCEGGDLNLTLRLSDQAISIHAPCEGGDCCPKDWRCGQRHFNPRPLRGGRQHRQKGAADLCHFNPRPLRGGRLRFLSPQPNKRGISIHAPGEGGDNQTMTSLETILSFQSTPPARGATPTGGIFYLLSGISIHAPCEGGDFSSSTYQPAHWSFQSTPPARGATAKMHSFTCGSLTNK